MINKQECCLSVWKEHPVDREAGTVSDHYWCLLDLLPHIQQGDNCLQRGTRGADYLKKRHDMSWTVEKKGSVLGSSSGITTKEFILNLISISLREEVCANNAVLGICLLSD